jgi:hypothetical protein
MSVPLMKFWSFNDYVTRRPLPMQALETYVANILLQVTKSSDG